MRASDAKGSSGELILLPSLRANPGPNGGLVLTSKYLSGAAQYARTWPGKVTSLVALDRRPTTDLDHVEVLAGETDPCLELRPAEPARLAERLARARVVLAHLSRSEAALAQLCERIDVALVYGTEYSLATERQIIDSETRNPILRLRRKLWAERTERIRIRAVKRARGVQCSGTPTYEVYRHHQKNALLFFDNRVPAAQILTQDALEAKLSDGSTGRPLRLVFGGRWVPMKGVLHLPQVFRELERLGVRASLDIVGSGPQAAELAAAVVGLEGRVRLLPPMDFATGWIPALQRDYDLFLCCHPQGDPSSTYPEVMSCGVPIAGFGNEALVGVVAHSEGGWTVPMLDHRALAGLVARLDKDRQELNRAARAARAFAEGHAFEPTYAARVQHLLDCSA